MDNHDRQMQIEEELNRVKARRIAVPGSLGLFLVLGFFLMAERIVGATPGSPVFLWTAGFVAFYLAGITWSEISARRSTRRLNSERQALVAAGSTQDHLPPLT